MTLMLMTLLALTAPIMLLAACRDDAPEITIEDKLESIAGSDLTPAEIQRQLEVADTLCRTELEILTRMWDSMSDRQLRFQDFVFGDRCAERSLEYASATGRAPTAEAQEMLTESTSITDGSTGQTLPLPDSLISTTSTTPSATAAGS